MFALGTSSQTRGFFSTTRGLIAGRFSSVSPGQRLFIFLSEDETQRLTSRVAQSPVSNRRLSCSSIKSNELCRVDMTNENWPVRNDICHWSLAKIGARLSPFLFISVCAFMRKSTCWPGVGHFVAKYLAIL